MRGVPSAAMSSGFARNDLAAIVVAAGGAQVVRNLQLAAILAFLERRHLERIVAATHVALRRRRFSFRDGHLRLTFVLETKKLATFRAQLIGLPRGGGRNVANECAL